MFEAFTLKTKKVEQTEENLRTLVRQLSEADRKEFYQDFSNRIKDPDTYAVLNFFFVTGLHHFYLKKYARGSMNLFIFVFGISLLFSASTEGLGAGIFLILFIILIELPALFRSQIIVKDYNNRLTERILEK